MARRRSTQAGVGYLWGLAYRRSSRAKLPRRRNPFGEVTLRDRSTTNPPAHKR
jgi:hypothetical protein